MKATHYETQEAWMESRRGNITGSTLKDLIVKRGTEPKIGFYRLIAERVAVARDDEDSPMDRGHRLEEEAVKRFEQETEQKVDTSLVIWSRDDESGIAVSPDGFIATEDGKVSAAVEVKCLSPERHIEAWLTQKVPSEYEYQVLQYFAVNEDLEMLFFCFYDPSIPCKDFFYLEITRGSVQEEVDFVLAEERKALALVKDIVNELTF